ncbi:MAG: patatin-like phospholipase family protein [Rikenellaceae bacterium]
MLRILRSFITLFLLITINYGYSQSVGVVMSGGGAKGLYHIGVLEALEENGIPIDYVAGTSMGSIVAGLYAAGYSPTEMRDIVTSGEIEGWLSGRIDNSYGAYYRQYRSIPSLFSLRLDTKSLTPLDEELTTNYNNGADKSSAAEKNVNNLSSAASRASLYLPSSLISSTQVDMTLSRLFAAASESIGGKFENLMVPFLCVASDMRNHQAVVLTSGDLGESIRASMAIPIAFKPIKRDTTLLFDGGIYDNFPWKPLLEEHNPDFIIGSICTAGNTELTEQSSLIDQIFAITTQKSDYTLPEGNPTIQRDVPVGMLDFANGSWIIDLGYEDTMEQMADIKSKIVERRDSIYYDQRRQEFLAKVKPLIFESYQINGLTEEQNLYVHDFLHTSSRRNNVLQRKMPFEELQENLYQILSSGDFSTEYPTIKYNPHSQLYNFDIDLATKPQLKLSVGGHLTSTAFNQLFLSINYQQVKRVAQSYYADLYLGTMTTSSIIGGRTDFYIKSPLFIDYYFAYSNINRTYSDLGNITSVTNSESVKTRDNHFSVGSGFPLSRRNLLTLRMNIGWDYYYYETPDDLDSSELDQSMLYDRTRFSFGAAKLELQQNTLDHLNYPTSGSKLETSIIAVMGHERNYQDDYSRTISEEAIKHRWVGARIKYDKYFTPPGDSWFSLGVNFDFVATTLQQFGNPTTSMLMMPAYQPVAHSQMIFMPDYSAYAYAGAGIIPIVNIAPNMLLRTGFYGMYRSNYSIDGIDPDIIGSDRLHYVSEASLAYNSSLGALSLSLIKYDLNDWNNLYLLFGFGVPIFSPKGTYY